MMSEPREKLDISDLKDTFLECSVCVEHFNQTDRRPRLLHSCLHAFCTQCLHQLLIKEGKGQITCPLCRRVQKVTGNADSLPVDPVRSKLVDYVQIKHKQNVLCTECEAHDAVSRCQECQSYMCEECDFVHRRHRLSRDHTIISMEDVQNQPIKNFSKGHFCPSHPKHHLEFYCTTDKQLCCLSCTVVDHKGHDFQKLEEAAASRRHELETRLQETHKLADHLREIKEKGKVKEKLIVKAKLKSLSNINNVFDDLRTVLDQRKHQLIAAVLDKSNSLLSVAQKASAAHDQTLAIIESTDTYFKQAKEKADVVDMLQMYPAILRSIDGLQEPQQLSTLEANVDDFSSLKEEGKSIKQQIIDLGTRKEVQKVLKKKQEVEGKKLQVKLHIPKPCYKNRFLVTNLKKNTTKDSLFNYLEARSRCEVTNIDYGEHPGIALVTFDSETLPDLDKLRHQLKTKPLQGKIVEISPVPIADSVVVQGFSPDTSEETISYYFEGKRSGNKAGSEVMVTIHSEEAFCIVQFDDHKVVDEVLSKRTHKIEGFELTVSLYMECLGISRSDDDQSWYKQPEAFTMESLNKYKCRNVVEIPSVPIADSIVVQGFCPDTSEETISYYFESKRSGNKAYT